MWLCYRHRYLINCEHDMTEEPDILINPRLLMQDTDRALFEWFASRADARWVLRRVLAG